MTASDVATEGPLPAATAAGLDWHAGVTNSVDECNAPANGGVAITISGPARKSNSDAHVGKKASQLCVFIVYSPPSQPTPPTAFKYNFTVSYVRRCLFN